jgi:glycine/D-amino acid oxidase-like deaminating enzyme
VLHKDVLVIGAGVIGLCTAYHIKKGNPNLSVLVVDHNAAASQGETAKSFAAVRNCFTSEPNRLLAHSTIEFYKHAQENLGVNLGLELIGYLWLFTKSQYEHFQTLEKEMRGQGVQFKIWELDDLKSMIPDLLPNPDTEQSRLVGSEAVYKGVQGLNCGVVGPERVAGFYEAELRKLGGELQFKTDVQILKLGPKEELKIPGEPLVWQDKVFSGVETSEGSISADNIVVAAGVGSLSLFDAAGVDCPVKPKKRQVFQLRGPKALERLLTTSGFNDRGTVPVTILPRAGVHFRPNRGERSIWVACADDLGRPYLYEENPMPEDSYYNCSIYPILSDYFPCFTSLRPSNSWAGHYDINTVDRTPIVERVANCVIVTGMSGSGIMKADGIGRVAAAVLQGRSETTLFDGRKLQTSRIGLKNRSVGREELVL